MVKIISLESQVPLGPPIINNFLGEADDPENLQSFSI